MRFSGKVAIVTGGAAGIGAATAKRLASEGAQVVIGDLDAGGAGQVAADIDAAGGAARVAVADLRDEDSLRAMVELACRDFGGLDLLVNDAALGLPDDGTVVDTPQETWDRIYDVNLMGFVRTCRVAVPRIAERGGGAIVNLSSGAAINGEPVRIAYGSSKAAIAGLTRNLAAGHAGQGIRVNAIAPGLIATQTAIGALSDEFVTRIERRIPLGRLGRPEDIAGVIAFLLSDDGSYVTGQLVSVDGGMLAVARG